MQHPHCAARRCRRRKPPAEERLRAPVDGVLVERLAEVGPRSYSDSSAVARAYPKAAPERCVWGSDWPHPTEKDKPDDAPLLDLLTDWVPDEKARHRVLVENPAVVYGF